MQVSIFKLEAKSEVRSFDSTSRNGGTQQRKAIDVVLTDGANKFVATAYDELAEEAEKASVNEFYEASLSFSVKERSAQDGHKFMTQEVTVRSWLPLFARF